EALAPRRFRNALRVGKARAPAPHRRKLPKAVSRLRLPPQSKGAPWSAAGSVSATPLWNALRVRKRAPRPRTGGNFRKRCRAYACHRSPRCAAVFQPSLTRNPRPMPRLLLRLAALLLFLAANGTPLAARGADLELSESVQLPECHSLGWVRANAGVKGQ